MVTKHLHGTHYLYHSSSPLILLTINKMKISVKANSSSGDPYTVDFIHNNGLLSVFCNCAAGEWGKFCKHKWQLLSGNRAMLAYEDDVQKLQEVESWVKLSSISSLFDEVNDLERELEEKKTRLKKAKKEVERKMKEGF